MSTVTEVAAQSACRVTAEQDEANKVLVVRSDKPKSALEAISQGASLPSIPCYSDMDHQRRFMLEHMAGAFRVFARKGYTEGMSGHISLRDPENPEYFWTNPYVLSRAKRQDSGLTRVTDQTWSAFWYGIGFGPDTTGPRWPSRGWQHYPTS